MDSSKSNNPTWQDQADRKAVGGAEAGKVGEEKDDESSKINSTYLISLVIDELKRVGEEGMSLHELQSKISAKSQITIKLKRPQIDALRGGYVKYEANKGSGGGWFTYDPKYQIKDEMSLIRVLRERGPQEMREIERDWIGGEKKKVKEMVERMWKAGLVCAVGLHNENFVLYSRPDPPYFAKLTGSIGVEKDKYVRIFAV